LNLDFSSDPLFSWYVVFLVLSGVIMVALAAAGSGSQSNGMRALNGLIGVAFLGYGIYLGFIFNSGHYLLAYKAFVVPVLLVINFFKARAARGRTQPSPHQAPASSAPSSSHRR